MGESRMQTEALRLTQCAWILDDESTFITSYWKSTVYKSAIYTYLCIYYVRPELF